MPEYNQAISPMYVLCQLTDFCLIVQKSDLKVSEKSKEYMDRWRAHLDDIFFKPHDTDPKKRTEKGEIEYEMLEVDEDDGGFVERLYRHILLAYELYKDSSIVNSRRQHTQGDAIAHYDTFLDKLYCKVQLASTQ